MKISDGTLSIGEQSFAECDNLAKAEIGNSVQSIGDSAFDMCVNLAELNIGNSVITVGQNAFFRCEKLLTINIPDSVQTIYAYAFYGCTGLTKINIGSGVTSIVNNAFYMCTSLESINVSENNTVYKSLDGVLYTYDLTTLVYYPTKRSGEIIIPKSVTAIASNSSSDFTIDAIYYQGTEEEWANITIDVGNISWTDAPRYYYSESEPVTKGNFWHYDDNGNVVVWSENANA